MSRLGLFRALPGLYRGRHVRHPAVRIERARSVSLTVDPPAALIADGETLAESTRQARFDVWPRALLVVA
jgi:diacylglycerol kinase (ATP)